MIPKWQGFSPKKNLGGPSASVVYNGLDKLSFDVKIPFKKKPTTFDITQ